MHIHTNSFSLLFSFLLVVLLAFPFLIVKARGGGLGSSTIFKKFHEPYALS